MDYPEGPQQETLYVWKGSIKSLQVALLVRWLLGPPGVRPIPRKRSKPYALHIISSEVMDPILQRRNAFSQGILCPISDNNRLHTRTVHLLHRHFIICIICMQIMSTYLFALQTILLDLGRQMHRRMFYKAVIPSVSPSACRFWCNNLLPSKYGTHHIPR